MTQSLRIAMISEHASPLAVLGGVDAGGQNIYVAQVARCLAAAGHHVDVFTRRDDTRLPAQVEIQPGLRVVHVDAGPPSFVPKERLLQHMPMFATEMERMLRVSTPYDLAHANFFMSGMVAQRLKRTRGLPFVMTFHALGLVRREHQKDADTFPVERLAIERALVREADAVVAECPQDHQDLVRLYGAQGRRLRTVPCGFDADEFSPQDRLSARHRLGIAPGEFVVLQLGRLVPRKGIDNVIRSLAHLPADIPARLLVVGGDGPEPDEARTPEIGRLRAVAREHGVEARVTFTGQRRRDVLRHYYAAADVFATTPWYEPFGITPLEAMACARPVVGSDVGGIKYSVQHGVTGWLVPAHDPAALAARLRELHDKPMLARAMGLAGARRARSMFTWEQVARGLMDVYLEAIDRRPPAWQAAPVARTQRVRSLAAVAAQPWQGT